MSFLLVGEAPNDATCGRPELWLLPDNSGVPHSANALREHAGFSHREYREVFARRDNVLHRAPPRSNSGKGYTFPVAPARAGAAALLERYRSFVFVEKVRGLVILGKRAAGAFAWHEGLLGVRLPEPPPFFDWACLGEHDKAGVERFGWTRAVVVPHPSGFNRWWNEQANRDRARAFFSSLLAEHRHHHG